MLILKLLSLFEFNLISIVTSVDTLKREIGEGTWMTDEYIQLLVKEKKYKEAISLHVQKKEYDKVEEFCKNH